MSVIVSDFLLLVGAVFMLLAAVGLVRMPDLFSRMQAATKAATLGAGCILAAAAVHFADLGVTSRVIGVIAFIVITAPVAAHVIGRISYFVGVPLWEGTVVDDLGAELRAAEGRGRGQEEREAIGDEG